MRAEFIAGVSHELRTPLTQIRMFAELLQTSEISDLNERLTFARIIDDEAQRLSQLVANVLSFSRLSRGEGALAEESLGVSDEFRAVLRTFAPLARQRAVTVRYEADEDTRVVGDAAALRQVLLNLLDNALKYGPARQTITMGASHTGQRVRIWVDDAGPGVP